MKKCSRCGVVKKEEEFYKKTEGLESKCKTCKKQVQYNYRQRLLQRKNINLPLKKTCCNCGIDKPTEEFYKDRGKLDGLRESCKTCQYNRTSSRHVKNPAMLMLRNARARAKSFGLEFNLELSDIVIPEKCPIMGVPLYAGKGHSRNNSPSLDRIDNSRGYIKGNVAVISQQANSIKREANIKQIENLLKYMKQDLDKK